MLQLLLTSRSKILMTSRSTSSKNQLSTQKNSFLKTGNISSQKMLLTRYKYISYSSFGCVEVYYKQFPGADQVAPSPSTIAEEIQNEPAREWQRCGWMSMNICITTYWESGVTGGQQTFGDLEKTDIYCSVRVEFPLELCGRTEKVMLRCHREED